MPSMTFTGTREECDAYVARMLGMYPTPGYGTWFNWPPGKLSPAGRLNPYNAPTDHGGGRWTVRGDRQSNCD